jgi:hypothetical protein
MLRITTATHLGAAIALVGGLALSAVPAQASEPLPNQSNPETTFVDTSFDAAAPSVRVDENGVPQNRAFCPDVNFAALPVMQTSVPGCNVIGSSSTAKVQYKWYVQHGGASCMWGKGFNASHSVTWTEVYCGTGGSRLVPWGAVAASKQMKGLTVSGAAGIQWS